MSEANTLNTTNMASSSESGHVKNVSSFETQISMCKAYGSDYNPSRTELKIPALELQLGSAKNSLLGTATAKTVLDNATNHRRMLFSPIRTIAARIINVLDASGASKETLNDAKGYIKRMRGRPSASTVAAGGEKRKISTSQLSYDYLLDNFSKLVTLIETEPLYKPNEEDLKTATQKTYITSLHEANTAVIKAHTSYNVAMLARDRIFYAEKTGLVDIAMDVKKYIKAAAGFSSPEYKKVSKIRYSRPVVKFKSIITQPE